MRKILTVLTAVTAGSVMSGTAKAELKVGDPAPPLTVTTWIKDNPFPDWTEGKPIDLSKSAKGKVVVLEFWATWCGPCLMLIPHNTEIASKYADGGLIFIGLTDSDRGQQLGTVQQFVERKGDAMSYSVGYDKTQQNLITYVYASGAPGLPYAMIVDKQGKIAWLGHPGLPVFEQVIQDLLLDRFDPKALERLAAMEARLQPLVMDFNTAAMSGDWQKCVDLTDAMLAIDPTYLPALDNRIKIQLNELDDADALRKWAEAFIDQHGDNAVALMRLAQMLSSITEIEQRQPDLALKAATAAYKKDANNTAVIETLASVSLGIGNVDRAIELQRQAIENANPIEAAQAKKVLDYYERCKALAATVSSG